MITLIRSELDQLRSLSTTWLLPLGLLGLVALITGASTADVGKPGGMTPSELREPLVAPAGIMSAVAIAVFAAIRVGGDYRYETINLRFLASARSRVVFARFATYCRHRDGVRSRLRSAWGSRSSLRPCRAVASLSGITSRALPA